LYQKVRTSASEESPPPCSRNFRTGQTLLTANVFYGQPLIENKFKALTNLIQYLLSNN